MPFTPALLLRWPLLATCAALALPASSQEQGPPAPIAYFYDALRNADHAMMGVILAEEVVIVLQDLGVEQSKLEFMASLDEWESMGEDLKIDVTVLESDTSSYTVQVCYDMGESQQLTEEHFEIENEQIVSLTQATIADNCDGTSRA